MADIQIHKIHQSIGLIHKNLECSVCLEILQDPVSTKCGHQFCRFCILAVLQTKPTAPCPLCKKVITKRGLTENTRLKEIVAAVNNVTSAIEQDSGTKCSPPRGAVILSQCSQPTPSPDQLKSNKKKLKKHKSTAGKKNLRQSKPKCTSSMEIFIDGDDESDVQIQEPSRSNTNISTGFPAPSKPSIKNNKKNHGEEDGLLAALERAPLRPTTDVGALLDPYEFIASQRTPKKKPKRKGKRSNVNASNRIKQRNLGKNVANKMKESRKARMKTVVAEMDVHVNGDNEVEDWNNKEIELNITNATKNQEDTSRTIHEVSVTTNGTKKQSPVENGAVLEVDIIDPGAVTEQCIDEEEHSLVEETHTSVIDTIGVQEDMMNDCIRSDDKEEDNSLIVDGEINFEQQDVYREKSIDDEGSEDWENRPKRTSNENGMLFKKVYTIKRFRKSNSPQRRGNESISEPVINEDNECKGTSSGSNNDSAVTAQEINEPVIDEVAGKENGKLTKRKKMQKSLRQFGTSEDDAPKSTHRIATRNFDKSDWEIAIELAQEFGTLPKELLSKRHSSRRVKPEVNVQGAAKTSTEKSKPRKARTRKSLLTEDDIISDEDQIQEFSDSCVERKLYSLRNSQINVPPRETCSDPLNKCEEHFQTRSVKARQNSNGEITNIRSIKQSKKSSPQLLGEPCAVPETPLIPHVKDSTFLEVTPKETMSLKIQKKVHSKDFEEDREQSEIEQNTEVGRRRSKRQSYTNISGSNDHFNLDCTRSAAQRRSKRKHSDVRDAANVNSEGLIDQPSSLRNSLLSNETITSADINTRQKCNSQIRLTEKGCQKEVIHTKSNPNRDMSTPCAKHTSVTSKDTECQNLVSDKVNSEDVQGDCNMILEQGKHCQDQPFKTSIDGDSTDSIELSVSDIEYEEPSLVHSEVKNKLLNNDDHAHHSSHCKRNEKKEPCTELCEGEKEETKNISGDLMTDQCSEGSTKKCKRSQNGGPAEKEGSVNITKDAPYQSGGRCIGRSKRKVQRGSKDGVHDQTMDNVVQITSGAECHKGSQLSNDALMNQSSDGSRRKSKRSLRSNKVVEQNDCLKEKVNNGSTMHAQDLPDEKRIQMEDPDEFVSKKEVSIDVLEDNCVTLAQSPEIQKKLRRSKRKTFALGNTPEKVQDIVMISKDIENKKNTIRKAKTIADMDESKQGMSLGTKSAELFSNEPQSEVLNYHLIDNSAAPKQCNNDIGANYSQEGIVPPSIELNTNSDLLSDADQVCSSISNKRKSRGRSRGSQSSRKSSRISGNVSTTSSAGCSENMLLKSPRISGNVSSTSSGCSEKMLFNSNSGSQSVNRMVENEVSPEVKTTEDSLHVFRRSRGSTKSNSPVLIDENRISSKVNSSNNRDTTRRNLARCSQLPNETEKSTQRESCEIIPASKGESQSSDMITPPIIDYRPVMRNKRLTLKKKKSDVVSNSSENVITSDIHVNETNETVTCEDRIGRGSAKSSLPNVESPNNSEAAHSNHEDVTDDEDNTELEMEAETNKCNLASDVNVTRHSHESQNEEVNKGNRQSQSDQLTDGSSSDDEDGDSVIPPTPNNQELTIATKELRSTRFSKNAVPEITITAMEGTVDLVRKIESLKKDGSDCQQNSCLSAGNHASQGFSHSDRNSLSAFHHVLDVQKVQPISPLGPTPEKVRRGNCQTSETVKESCPRTSETVKTSQAIAGHHKFSGDAIDDDNSVDKPTPELLESDVNMQSSQPDSLVEGVLYSDDDDCSEDECYPIHNANSVSSLLSSEAEILNTQQRETAKEEMEKIAQQIQALEAAMKDGRSMEKDDMEELAEDVKEDDMNEIPGEIKEDDGNQLSEDVGKELSEDVKEDDVKERPGVIKEDDKKEDVRDDYRKELSADVRDNYGEELAEDVKGGSKLDEDFNPECLSDSESEIMETDEEVEEQVCDGKTSQQKLKLAKGRSRILRQVIDSDSDEEEVSEVGRSSHGDSDVEVVGGESGTLTRSMTNVWRATSPSSNSCLKSPSQSLLHSPRSPSPPPPVSSEVLLKESPLELQQSNSHTVVQEYRNSGRKRKVIGDASSRPHATPKRPRVDETEERKATSRTSVELPVEHAPVKVEKNYSFIATGLSRFELNEVEQLSQRSGFPFASRFNNNTTHVIVKTDSSLVCERTLKYFQGIAGKKWVISFKWVEDSLKAGRLLAEEEYEVVGDVASGTTHMGPKRSRMQTASLLHEYDICCIGEFTMLTKGQLTQLLELTGVTKVSHPAMFSFNPDRKAIIIAQSDVDQEPINFKGLFRKFEVPVVSREWILDSIAPSIVQPLEDYLVCDVPDHVLNKY